MAFIDRQNYESTIKPKEKYGDGALTSGGDLTRDVCDYYLNELAGLERYGEMVRHRWDAMYDVGSHASRKMRILTFALDAIVRVVGPELEVLRTQAILDGHSLGKPERE